MNILFKYRLFGCSHWMRCSLFLLILFCFLIRQLIQRLIIIYIALHWLDATSFWICNFMFLSSFIIFVIDASAESKSPSFSCNMCRLNLTLTCMSQYGRRMNRYVECKQYIWLVERKIEKKRKNIFERTNVQSFARTSSISIWTSKEKKFEIN